MPSIGASAADDLVLTDGQTYTLVPGEHTYNDIKITTGATLRITGAANVTCSRLEVNGTIILSGDVSFLCTYGQENPGTDDWTVWLGQNSDIHCDFHLDGPADDGEPGQRGAESGDDGTDGQNGQDGHDGYNLSFIVHGHVEIERSTKSTINLAGQQGGDGGAGGDGVIGDGAAGLECVIGGPGGHGADGGDGGDGGHGGNLTWVIHGSFQDELQHVGIASYLLWDVSGGAAGYGGFAGAAGPGGHGADDALVGCEGCLPGGNAGSPGFPGNGGSGGNGGTIRINGQSMLGIYSLSYDPIKANGGTAGAGGRGGNGGDYGPGGDVPDIGHCADGTSNQGTMHGIAGAAGNGGNIVITLSCALDTKKAWQDLDNVLYLQANGGRGGGCNPPGNPGLDRTPTRDGLDAMSTSTAGGNGGSLSISASSASVVDFEAKGGTGGFGADGASFTYDNVNFTIHGGDGADGAPGGMGGTVVFKADTRGMTDESPRLDGGPGGDGGAGGGNTWYEGNEGDDGLAGSPGTDGSLTQGDRALDWFAAGLAVNTLSPDPGTILTYTPAVISENFKSDVTLSVTIPEHTSYVSGGTRVGDTVSWDFETLEACALGLGELKLRVDRNAASGTEITCQSHATYLGGGTEDSDPVTVTVSDRSPPAVIAPWLNILFN